MNPADDIEHAIAELHITTKAETDKRILDDAYVALGKGLERQRPGTWRMIVSSRITWPAAAAAVILVALTLFFRVPAAKAVSLSQIYEALGKVSNICIARFTADTQEPAQKEWVSQTLNISMFQIGERFVLWDLANKLKKTKSSLSGSVEASPIPEKMLATAKERITSAFGLVPFSDMNEVPAGTQWTRVDEPEISTLVPGTEVYDLTWLQKSVTGGAARFIKWRVFVDTHNNLPERTEWYSKLKPEDQYRFQTSEVITYPSEDEIQALIRSTFGPPDRPEYIGTPGTDR